MVDLLLSNRRSVQCEDMHMLLPCHVMDVGQVCTSSAIAYYVRRQSSRHKFSVPDPRFVYQNAHQRPSYLNKSESKI
jgi:protein-tyrosine phosphatase